MLGILGRGWVRCGPAVFSCWDLDVEGCDMLHGRLDSGEGCGMGRRCDRPIGMRPGMNTKWHTLAAGSSTGVLGIELVTLEPSRNRTAAGRRDGGSSALRASLKEKRLGTKPLLQAEGRDAYRVRGTMEEVH